MKPLLRKPWFGPLVALVIVYLLFALASPDTFARPTNLVTMARQTVVYAMASLGMTLVIVSGGIDLSVGSQVALTTVVVAKVLNGGMGPFAAALVGILLATACALVVGVLVGYARISPFVATLGAMTVLRGTAKGLAHEQKIDANAAGLDALLGVLPAAQRWMLFPPGVFVLVLASLLAAGLLTYTTFGRHIVAIGSNERTARLCGVDVSRTKMLIYALAGTFAGLAGVMEFSTLTVGDPTDSVGLELSVIAATVIGGASLSGGEGSVAGAVVGALLMTVIKTGCTHVGLPNWVEEVLTGIIIVVAVAVDRVRHRARMSGP